MARVVANRIGRAVFGLDLRQRTEPASERELQRVDTLAGISWSVVQLEPLIGYALQTQHLQLALRSGDRRRAAIAWWLEAPVGALKGSRGAADTQRILAAARAMTAGLEETQFPTAVVQIVEGVVALLEGRWRDGLRHLNTAEELPNSGLIGHSSLRASIYSLQAMNLFWLGRSGELLQNVPSQIREMEDKGNVYGWAWLKLMEAWALSCSGQMDAAWAASDIHLYLGARVALRCLVCFDPSRSVLDLRRERERTTVIDRVSRSSSKLRAEPTEGLRSRIGARERGP